MIEEDREYFQRRAEQEVASAQKSTKSEVVAIHYELSELYLAQVLAARVDSGEEVPRKESQASSPNHANKP